MTKVAAKELQNLDQRSLVAILVLARRKPGYRHLRHTISELGEVGAPDQKLVAFGVFVPVGLLLAVIAFLFRVSHPPQCTLAACLATGYLVAAVFPGDPGSPLSGSLRQGIHNLGGAIEYAGGTLALFWLAESSGMVFRGAGFLVGAAMLTLSFPHPLRGGIQRVAELCLFGGLMLSLWLTRGGLGVHP